MNNIMEVQGYTLHRHNNELMIEDLELGRRLGYERPHSIRKVIRKMLEIGQIKPQEVFSIRQKPGMAGGRPGETFFLNQKGALKAVARSEAPKAIEITEEVIDVYLAARKGESQPRHQDGVTVPFKRAETVTRSTLALCKMFGTALGMARAIAVEEVRRATGLDLSRLIAGNQVEEVPLTPTRLGEEAGLSGADMNRVLLHNGLQVKTGPSKYEPTAKGRPFCTLNPFKSPYSEHTDYRPLWFRRVLDVLDLSHFDADTGSDDPPIPQHRAKPLPDSWDGFVPDQE